MAEKRRPVLADHIRKKQKLVPPFVATMGDTLRPFSWARDITPEAIWLALLIKRYSMYEAAHIAAELCSKANGVVGDEQASVFARLSAFRDLSESQQKSLLDGLSFRSIQKLKRALAPLMKICEEFPLHFIFAKGLDEPEISEIHPNVSEIIGETSTRLGDLASKSAAVATYAALAQGKLLMPQEILEETKRDFELLGDETNSEAYKNAGGRFRAGAPGLLGVMGPERNPDAHNTWVKEFWDTVGKSMKCVQRIPIEYDEEPEDIGSQLVAGSRNCAKNELEKRLDAWSVDLTDTEPREVIGALLARQVTIFCDIALSPNIWNPNTAPTLLRTMADVYINLAWICSDPITRSKEFISYGLGSKKLEIAHRKDNLAQETNPADAEALEAIIEAQQTWVDAQRMDQFVEVNLGNWAGTNTRTMSEQAGCKDFYNYVFKPFSECVHSSWAHIGQYNASICANPGHRGHWIPTVVEFEPDPHWLFLAAKYLDKTMRTFDEQMDISVDVQSTLDFVVDTLNELYRD